MNDNDPVNGSAPAGRPDDHGQAALLLAESLIHGLCESQTMSTAQAVEIVERAVDVQRERAETANGAGASLWHAHALLASIAASLTIDEREASMPPPSATQMDPPDG